MTDAEKVRRAVEPDEHGETTIVGDPAHVARLLAAEVRRLRALAAPLTYSQTAPAAPGWYWWRHQNEYSNTVAEVVEVVEEHGEKVIDAGGESCYSPIRVRDLGGEWAGPIPEPQEPTR